MTFDAKKFLQDSDVKDPVEFENEEGAEGQEGQEGQGDEEQEGGEGQGDEEQEGAGDDGEGSDGGGDGQQEGDQGDGDGEGDQGAQGYGDDWFTQGLNNFYQPSEENPLPPEIVKGVDKDGKKLSPEERLQAYQAFLFSNAQFGNTPEQDAFVRNFLVASQDENFNMNDYIQNYSKQANILTLPSKEFLKQVYKHTAKQEGYDWSDEEINKKVDSMDSMQADMEAKKYKKEVQKTLSARQEKDLTETLDKTKKDNKLILNKYLSTITGSSSNTIGGFEFSEAEKKEFVEGLPGFFEKKIVESPDGGKYIASEADELITELLTDEEKSMTLLPFLWMIKNDKLKGFSSNLKEKVKKSIEDGLDDGPGKQSGQERPTGFDADSFFRRSQQ